MALHLKSIKIYNYYYNAERYVVRTKFNLSFSEQDRIVRIDKLNTIENLH